MTAETDGYDPSSARLRSLSIELFILGIERWAGIKEKCMRPTTLWRQPGLMNREVKHAWPEAIDPRQFVEQNHNGAAHGP